MFMSLSTLHNSCYNYITRLVSGNIYASIQNTKYALLSLVEFTRFLRGPNRPKICIGRTKPDFKDRALKSPFCSPCRTHWPPPPLSKRALPVLKPAGHRLWKLIVGRSQIKCFSESINTWWNGYHHHFTQPRFPQTVTPKIINWKTKRINHSDISFMGGI